MHRLAGLLALVAALATTGCDLEQDGDAGDRSATAAAPAAQGATEPAEPAGTGAGGLFARIPEIVRDVAPSVVAVLVETGQGEGQGSGVIWAEDGLIVTNAHVVGDAPQVVVALASGERLDARVRASDPLTDLAVLETDRDGLPAASFADGLPAVGELAVALGNPLGFENSVTAGIVSGLHRDIPSGGQTPALVDLLQTDAAISPGNSGGALVNADGEVIGINVAFIPPEARAVSIGFAIPSPRVVDVVEQLLETGRVEHAFLGVQPAPLTPQIAERFGLETEEGALVLEVVGGSPAERAGLEPGDVVVAVDGDPVRTVEDLLSALRQHSPGEEVELTILRDGERRSLTATLAERPQ